MSYYPLAVGNTWTYRNKDGSTFTNTVTGGDGVTFAMQSTAQPQPQAIRIENGQFLTDSYQAGTWQVLLSQTPAVGDAWDISYQANGIDTVLKMSVKEIRPSMQVEGQTYMQVAVIEGDMQMTMNGAPIPMSYQAQYFYADGVGLVLTTSSHGDSTPLIGYQLA